MRSSPRRLLPKRRSALRTTFIAVAGAEAQEAQEAEGREDSQATTDFQAPADHKALPADKVRPDLQDLKDQRQPMSRWRKLLTQSPRCMQQTWEAATEAAEAALRVAAEAAEAALRVAAEAAEAALRPAADAAEADAAEADAADAAAEAAITI